MAIKFGWNATNKAAEGANAKAVAPKKAAAGGVNKRTGRVGAAAAKKGKAKKAATPDEELSNDGDAVMEDGSNGEV